MSGDIRSNSTLEQAYDQLDALLIERHERGADSELDKRIDAAWADLRQLQEHAMLELREQLDEQLELPSSELRRLLAEADRILEDE